MIRVYKQFVEKAFLLALHFNGRGYSLDDAREYANYNWPRRRGAGYPPGSYQEVLQFLDREPINDSMQDHIDEAKKLLTTQSGADRDLIDTVVRIIGLPYAKNLGPGVVQALRRAILTADEIANLREQVDKQECLCSNCKHKFESGEMATFSRDGDSVQFYCTKCVKPESLACDACEASMPLGKSLHAVLFKEHRCDAHKPAKPEDKQVEAAQEMLGWARGIEGRLHQGAAQVRAGRGVDPAQPPQRRAGQNEFEAFANLAGPEPVVGPRIILPPGGEEDR